MRYLRLIPLDQYADPFGSSQLIYLDQGWKLMRAEQLRAGRALTGQSQAQIAASAGLSIPTIKRLESGKGPNVTDGARAQLVLALEAAGVIFIDENGEGPGVRLRKDRLAVDPSSAGSG